MEKETRRRPKGYSTPSPSTNKWQRRQEAKGLSLRAEENTVEFAGKDRLRSVVGELSFAQMEFPYFEIFISQLFAGGSVAIGVGRKDFPDLQYPGWIPGSFGYHSDDGQKYCGYHGSYSSYDSQFAAGATVGCGWYRGVCYFTRNGEFCGVAFTRIPPLDELYPVVGMNYPTTLSANFGTRPFKYDLSKLRSDFIQRKEREGDNELSFLLNSGYKQWCALKEMIESHDNISWCGDDDEASSETLSRLASVHMAGPSDTPWEGGRFRLKIIFSDPPWLQFESFIVHPLVDDWGNVQMKSLCCEKAFRGIDDSLQKLLTPEPISASDSEKMRDYCRFYNQGIWTPQTHSLAPRQFKTEVKLLLLLNNRQRRPLPREILFHIFAFLMRQDYDFETIISLREKGDLPAKP